MALQHQHHAITALDANSFEIVGGSCGFLLDVLEGEAALGAVIGNVQHGQLFRLGAAQFIDDIKSEIKLFCVVEADCFQQTVFNRAVNKLAVNTGLLIRCLLFGVRCCNSCGCGVVCCDVY